MRSLTERNRARPAVAKVEKPSFGARFLDHKLTLAAILTVSASLWSWFTSELDSWYRGEERLVGQIVELRKTAIAEGQSQYEMLLKLSPNFVNSKADKSQKDFALAVLKDFVWRLGGQDVQGAEDQACTPADASKSGNIAKNTEAATSASPKAGVWAKTVQCVMELRLTDCDGTRAKLEAVRANLANTTEKNRPKLATALACKLYADALAEQKKDADIERSESVAAALKSGQLPAGTQTQALPSPASSASTVEQWSTPPRVYVQYFHRMSEPETLLNALKENPLNLRVPSAESIGNEKAIPTKGNQVRYCADVVDERLPGTVAAVLGREFPGGGKPILYALAPQLCEKVRRNHVEIWLMKEPNKPPPQTPPPPPPAAKPS